MSKSNKPTDIRSVRIALRVSPREHKLLKKLMKLAGYGRRDFSRWCREALLGGNRD
jgi:hypothetical protein